MITTGQLPAEASEWVTVSDAPAVQPSVMVILPAIASSAETVVAAAGASDELHPSEFMGDNVPAITGEVLSSTLIVWTRFDELPHASVTV